jgi:hypothetical protein
MPVPIRSDVLTKIQERIVREWIRQDIGVAEFGRRMERRGVHKDRSAWSHIKSMNAVTTPDDLSVMADEVGLRLTWHLERRRAA